MAAPILILLACASSLVGCGTSPRDQLARMGIPFSVVSLMSAAEAGDLHVVRLFLEAGMTANGTDEHRRSVVSAAASGGNPDIVALLLESGADPNIGDEQTRTPLMGAASNGHAEAARLLLARGANAQAVRADGMTVLMQAAAAGHPEVLEVLLSRDVDLDRTDQFGATALIHAVMNRHAGTAQLLLSHGADPDVRTRTDGAFARETRASARALVGRLSSPAKHQLDPSFHTLRSCVKRRFRRGSGP